MSHLHLGRLRAAANGVRVGGVSCLEETELVRPRVAVQEEGEALAEGEGGVAGWEEPAPEPAQAEIVFAPTVAPRSLTK